MKAHAVVNAANDGLKHIGGLAQTLAKAAGTSMAKECRQYIKNHGSVPVGSCFTTTAGEMTTCRHIIHAIGPDYRIEGQRAKAKQLLKSAFRAVVLEADNIKATVVAVPLLSTGKFHKGFFLLFGSDSQLQEKFPFSISVASEAV